jgi:hypothetical protein
MWRKRGANKYKYHGTTSDTCSNTTHKNQIQLRQQVPEFDNYISGSDIGRSIWQHPSSGGTLTPFDR